VTVEGPMPRRLLPATLLLLAGCGLPSGPEFPTEGVATAEGTRLLSSEPTDRQSMAEALATQPTLPLTHGALSRERGAELEARLDHVLRIVQPQINDLIADLQAAVAQVPRPERLAVSDPVLKTWRAERRKAYQEAITLFHDEAARRLTELRDAATAEAVEQARPLAAARGPMDAGPTGDPALDEVLATFAEVIDGVVGLSELSVRRSQDLERRVDLYEAFTSFGRDEETAMGGRIHLFVGGDETDGVPRALLAFRVDDGRDPAALHFVQGLRHRILRGNTVVEDLGWHLAPFADVPARDGRPAVEVLENLLLASRVEPVINREAPAYEKLKDMRIQCDMQSAVFEGDRLLGGVDWRIEFVVSITGALSWQVAAKPIFDPGCAEVLALIGR
jgi:hypothetical protein